MGKTTLLCIKGTPDKIERILRKYKIVVAFSPPNTIRKTLDWAKEPVDPDKQIGVYIILCSCGKEYIGETGHAVRIRVKGHSSDIMYNRIKRSTLAEHSVETC